MNTELSVPGKIFLLGEYSVLAGEPALLAAIKLYSNEPKLGFGSSTAKWVMDNANSEITLSTTELWKNYCIGTSRGSGADLVAQNEAFLGQGSLFEIQTNRLTHEIKVAQVTPNLNALSLVHVFSAALDLNRKMWTDGALKNISGQPRYPKTASFIDRWKNAKTAQDFTFLNEWVQEFVKLGLETEAAALDRQMISQLKGVTAVKGCGAGLNDVFLVVMDQTILNLDELRTTIRKIENERHLKYLGTLSERLWKS